MPLLGAAEMYVTGVIPTDSSSQHKGTDVVPHAVLQTPVRANSLHCTFILGLNENGWNSIFIQIPWGNLVLLKLGMFCAF